MKTDMVDNLLVSWMDELDMSPSSDNDGVAPPAAVDSNLASSQAKVQVAQTPPKHLDQDDTVAVTTPTKGVRRKDRGYSPAFQASRSEPQDNGDDAAMEIDAPSPPWKTDRAAPRGLVSPLQPPAAPARRRDANLYLGGSSEPPSESSSLRRLRSLAKSANHKSRAELHRQEAAHRVFKNSSIRSKRPAEATQRSSPALPVMGPPRPLTNHDLIWNAELAEERAFNAMSSHQRRMARAHKEWCQGQRGRMEEWIRRCEQEARGGNP
ncbi:Hypothetical predicted protein [Lecanosticta acicola]|uniref:Uncharacterized protein n=1 Tax=Lecanosticta acicola TaxID=111012 RepID=A0AAI8YY93_9PEZI|nr:Hypothetical predicted protein [Lecanosticta acicola]